MKTTNLLKFLGALSIFALISLSFTWAEKANENDWTLLKSQDNVNVYGMITDCEQQSIYLFKVENLSSASLNATLTIGVPTEPAYGSKTFKVVVASKSSTTPLCSESELRMPKMNKASGSLNELTINLTVK